MDHIAILDKKRRFLQKIISGEKTIESRWYKTRRAPWNAISKGDTIYFKDCGAPITVKAKAKNILFFDDLGREMAEKIIKKYGKAIGFNTLGYTDYIIGKKYCVLIFLEDVQEITPFNIDKKGFGNACAWITVKDINYIRK